MNIEEELNKMYEYLEEHAYISKNKKSNYQFELTKERAECIANKYNSLCEEKDTEIERLYNIINDFEEELEREVNTKEEDTSLEHNTFIDINSTLKTVLKRFRELKGSDKE